MSSDRTTDTRSSNEIAVIGMSCRFPGASDVSQFWTNLCAGVESISRFSEEELETAGVARSLSSDPRYVPARGVLRDHDAFDAAFFGFSPREAEITDPQHRVFLEVCWAALENAGYEPGACRDPVGVFAGAATNRYSDHVRSHPVIRDQLNETQIGVSSEVDFLASRVSYKLGLRGPSLVVQTACSTSLVAVHLGCLSLLNYECDLALAGAVSIRLPQETGYLYREGGILSPDGHCRAFNANAHGSVSGNGVGTVVLKRLADAIADGDSVHAVIKGSAVNNDGNIKVGYTAPSEEAQVDVIAAAHADAEVNADSIGYVEAHGTGTPLGDRIELAALRRVFAASGRHNDPCVLGSVKTNIGHLNTAAGIAGLIKTVLVLKHGRIPPTLGAEAPHSDFDAASPVLRLNATVEKWGAGAGPRRAGVSSFGLGGTNCHVVLEEAPPMAPPASSRSVHLLPISARTETALDAAADALRRHVERHPGQLLADVAYTLQTGRHEFEHRRVAIGGSREQLGEALSGSNGAVAGRAANDEPAVAFLFPGVGDQYVGMGAQLYEREPTFRTWLERCAERLHVLLDTDLRDILFPDDGNAPNAAPAGGLDLRRMLGACDDDPRSRRLNETTTAHAALFSVEYALARLLMSWGVQPQAMLGDSLGEIVAAALSGVFNLEEALEIVVGRARLIASLPAGSMLAVPLSETEIQPYLGDGVALSIIHGHALVILAGEREAVGKVEQRLGEDGVAGRRVRNTHAVHTPAMAALAEPVFRLFSRVPLKPPTIPFISNVSGTWITTAEATDARYWARQVCETVRSADGLGELWREPGRIIVEVGPGQTGCLLAMQHPESRNQEAPLAVPTLRHGYDHRSDDETVLLNAVARLWVAGATVDWRAFHPPTGRQRVPLPTYPFERTRYWIEAAREAESASRRDRIAEPAQTDETVSDLAITAPHPRPRMEEGYTPPDSEHEQVIAGIWQDLLGIERIGVNDSFFQLGGHSLLAVQLVSGLCGAFGIAMPLRDLLEASTVSAQARRVRELQRGEASGDPAAGSFPTLVPVPGERHLPFPLTEVQEAYWVGRSDEFELGAVSTHSYVELESAIPPDRFGAAWRRVIDRHDMLRAVILSDATQRVLESTPPYGIEIVDARDWDETRLAEYVAKLRGRMSHEVKPLDQWPLFEIIALRLTDERTRYCLSFDLVMGDASSWQLVFRELRTLCDDPDAALEPFELSFRDYVLAERALREEERYGKSLEYWRERVPHLPSAPQLPLARKPESLESPRFSRRSGRLEKSTWERLKARAARADLTPSGLLLAAFSEVLAFWSRSPHFTLNLTLFNRLPLHPQVDLLMGDFTSLNLLEIDSSSGATFVNRAANLQRQLWQDLDHRYVTGVRVLRELARFNGSKPGAAMPVVFTSTLSLGEADEEASILARLSELGTVVHNITQTPQVWLDHQVYERDGELLFNWDAVEELFPAKMLDDMLSAYLGILERLSADDSTWQTKSFDLTPGIQKDQIARVNATGAPLPEGLAHSLFLQQAGETPDQVAVIADGTSLTYRELEVVSNRLAQRLRELGARPDSLVAVVMEKGWEQIAAVLGIVRSGAAYLPIDPENPPRRLQSLLARGEVELVLTQSCLDELLDWPRGVTRLRVDDEEVASLPVDPDLPDASLPGNLAYVCHTSGSTGAPKGVMIEHRSVVNRVVDVNRRFGLGTETKALALTALHHDLSVYDIFGVLAAGGTLVVPEHRAQRDPAHWDELIRKHGVSFVNCVPSFLEALVEYYEMPVRAGDVPQTLRWALLSGDWIPVSLPDRIRSLFREGRVISLGGPTETTFWDVHHPVGEVDPAWSSIPYGKPLTNAAYHVLDRHFHDRPWFVPGEIHISGAGLARGYWRDEALTAENFVSHPRTAERLYKSGDLGRRLPDGNIEILGRVDNQIKIRGLRIELEEIESVLREYPDIKEAAVSAVGTDSASRRLVAYVVPFDAEEFSIEAIDWHMKDRLPVNMVPASYEALRRLPRTATGKLDRSALPETRHSEAATIVDHAPNAIRSRIEQLLCAILEVDDLDPHRDLIQLGATSIDIMRLANAMEREFGTRPRIDEIYRLSSIANLAGAFAATEQAQSIIQHRTGPLTLPDAAKLASEYERIDDPDLQDAFKAADRGIRTFDESRTAIAGEPLKPGDAQTNLADQRRSHRRFSLQLLPHQRLLALLGSLRRHSIEGQPKYPYPSAGGLYPVQTYVYLKPGRVAGAPGGGYYYDPLAHRLVEVAPGFDLDRSVYSRLINRPVFDEAAFTIYLVGEPAAIVPLYGEHSLFYMLLEAGYMSQLLMMEAIGCRLGLCPIGDLDFDPLREPLQLRADHLFLHSLAGGSIDGSTTDATEYRAKRILEQIKQFSNEEAADMLNALEKGRSS